MEGLVDGLFKLPAKLDDFLISHGPKLPKGADAEIPLIKQDLEKMITILQDEDNPRSEESPMMVNCWTKEVRELSYDIDDCIDQYEHAAADPRSRSSFRIPRRKIFHRTPGSKTNRARLPENLKRRLWMANKIREFSRRSQAALERHSSFDLGNFICSSTRFDATFGSWHPTRYEERAGNPVGVDASMNKLEAWLTKDKDGEQKLKVVSVCGSGGVGKTTLSNELYRKIGGQFECRAFVRTSKRPDIRRLLINMLSQVAPHHLPDNWEVHSLIASIRTLLQDKRYLIVIDDVWATSTWEIVKCALPDGNGCSGILVTTEIEDVALRCCGYDSSYVFMMKPLVENDSRKLFFSTAFGPQHECPLELSEVSNSIIRKCGGLPLAVVTIASLLASRMGKVEQWDYVDKSLGYALRENPSIEGMKQVFNLCFDNLPQHLKACIMYLSIYQESYIIWKDDLVKQWTSEGFVCATEEKGEEEISRSYFDELISSRLIQPVHINGNYEVLSCTVHGMVHNFITHKSIEENFVTAVDQSQTTTRLADKVRRLSLQFGNAEGAPPTNMRLSQVRTLAFFGVFKCVPSILEFQLLQVLILDILGDEESISLDLTRITELYRLRYLRVTCNVILELRTQMWGLNFLPRLLHLNVPAQTKLPDGIGHMTSLHTLRYFDLGSNSAENVLSLGQLTNLEDLQFACCTIQTDNLKNNMQLLGIVLRELSKLTSLSLASAGSSHVGGGLSMSISGDGLRNMSSPPAFLRRLDLSPHVCTFTSLPDWIGHLSRLCILKIAVIELAKSDVDVIRGLPALTVLSLYVCAKLAERIVFDKGGFSVLKYLKFRCGVPWLKFEAGALPNLQMLKLGFNAPLVDGRDGAASIIIDHLPGLQEITAKIGGATADAQSSALTATVSSDPTNPTINVQLVDYTFYCDGSAKEEEQEVEILEEEPNEHEQRQAEIKGKRELTPTPANSLPDKKYTHLVSLSGHLFDKFLINEALDIIETAGGSFHLVKCDVGQSIDDMSYSELEVGADNTATLDRIIDSLTSVANAHRGDPNATRETEIKIGKVSECRTGDIMDKVGPKVLILGAGRVCRPAAEFLASYKNIDNDGANDYKTDQVHVIVASLYQKDAEETIDGIKNATAAQLDVSDTESLSNLVSQVEVVVSLLPASFHAAIARVCIELKKHLVTASYVDDSMSKLEQAAEGAGVTILCEMGLDPGIDHMLSMKMIDEAHARKGKIKAFTSFCGGLPSPAAANNPLAYKFSWSPAGAIRAGRNPAVYKFLGEIIHVEGSKLYESAQRLRLPELPAFALEHLPNRNSLMYGDLYGISKEASTVYRSTLRYEGFSEIMAILGKIGFFDAANHPLLQQTNRPTYRTFLSELLNVNDISTSNTKVNGEESGGHDDELISRLMTLGHCKEKELAVKILKTIKFLGLHEETEIPNDCSSALSVISQRMEQRMAYGQSEQDMVLLHHEVEVEYPDGRPTEKHQATLLEFGKTENGRSTAAMALTVGVPAAIGALLLLQKKVQRKGVIRPLEPEIYIPALEILEASDIKLMERVES